MGGNRSIDDNILASKGTEKKELEPNGRFNDSKVLGF